MEIRKLKLKFKAYALYLALSILISLSVAAIPAVILLLLAYQNLDPLINSIGWLFTDISNYVYTTFTGYLPEFFFERFWFVMLLIPIVLFCYCLFIVLLSAMFLISRRAIPYLEDGLYEKETGDWLYYEFYQAYYTVFAHFTGFLSAFLDARLRYAVFGAKIGKGSIIGGGHVLTPDRLIIGENCIIGFGSILCPHMYDGDKLYLKKIRIGNNVTVGGHVLVFAGADIGDNVILAANTVVPKNRVIPPNTIWFQGKVIPRKDKPYPGTARAGNPESNTEEEELDSDLRDED